jgi:hypothetical protein
VTLSWGLVSNENSVVISIGIGGVATPGNTDVYPTQTTTYWMTAVGPGGSTNASVTVNVSPGPGPAPVIGSFTANPSSISSGGSSTLQWSGIANATNITIDHGIGNVGTSGSVTVKPGATTTYTIIAAGPGGMTQKTATVNVNSPIVVPVVSQASPANGADLNVNPRVATLTWHAVNVPGGVTYSVEVEENQHGMWVPYASQSGISGLAYTTPAFHEDCVARWRVWAVSPSVGAGPKSDWWTFSITPSAHEYVGNWSNADSSASSALSRLNITASGETLNIHLWGHCIPNECDYGSVSVPFESEPVVASFSNGGSTVHVLNIYHTGGNTLRVVDTVNPSKPVTYTFRK